jgi:hypothetical protein
MVIDDPVVGPMQLRPAAYSKFAEKNVPVENALRRCIYRESTRAVLKRAGFPEGNPSALASNKWKIGRIQHMYVYSKF